MTVLFITRTHNMKIDGDATLFKWFGMMDGGDKTAVKVQKQFSSNEPFLKCPAGQGGKILFSIFFVKELSLS